MSTNIQQLGVNYSQRFLDIENTYGFLSQYRNEDYQVSIESSNKNEILFRCYNNSDYFENVMSINQFQKLNSQFKTFDSINNLFDYLVNNNKDNKNLIKSNNNNTIILSLNLSNNNRVDISLYKISNNYFNQFDILNMINKLNNNIYKMKSTFQAETNKMLGDIAKLKEDNNKKDDEISRLKNIISKSSINKKKSQAEEKEKDNKDYLTSFNEKYNTNVKIDDEELNFSNNYEDVTINKPDQNISANGLSTLSKIKFTKLKKLWIVHHKLTDINNLEKGSFNQLEMLNLSSNHLTDLQS